MYCVNIYNRGFHVLPFTYRERSRRPYLSNRLCNVKEPQLWDPSVYWRCFAVAVWKLKLCQTSWKDFLNHVALLIKLVNIDFQSTCEQCYCSCIDFAVLVARSLLFSCVKHLMLAFHGPKTTWCFFLKLILWILSYMVWLQAVWCCVHVATAAVSRFIIVMQHCLYHKLFSSTFVCTFSHTTH